MVWSWSIVAMLALAICFDPAAADSRKGVDTHSQDEATEIDQPVVIELKRLLRDDPALESSLRNSLRIANVEGIKTVASYLAYVNEFVTELPQSRSQLDNIRQFYFLVGQSEGLRQSEPFQNWLNDFAVARGAFMDTIESAADLEKLYSNPDYRIEDYQPTPSGWLTFNQFFARQVKPGKRPVAKPRDDTVVVSPADSRYQGFWPVSADSKITAKGMEYSIVELLADSEYAEAFAGGVFTHSLLAVTDYHRFHTPVAGTLVEKKKIRGLTKVDISRNPATGDYALVGGTGFQFAQTRGLIVLESENVGLVALLPIGMGPVSSVVLTADLGARLEKGEEFGYFQFGGSDIVTVYQAGKVNLTATPNAHYLQGEKLGETR